MTILIKVIFIAYFSKVLKKIYVLVAIKWSVFSGEGGQSIVTSYFRGSDFLGRRVTRGGGSKIGQNRVTSFMDGP